MSSEIEVTGARGRSTLGMQVMAEQREFHSFQDFWPFYVGAHRRPICRILHYCGSFGALALIAVAVATQNWWWLIGAPIVGYGFAWVGHFRYERNLPATFDYPLYSVLADFKMLALGVTGRMGAEVERYYGES